MSHTTVTHLQLATLLNVSAYPKPGLIHRISDSQHQKYEHSLASSAALVSAGIMLSEACEKIVLEKKSYDYLEMGKIIRTASEDIINAQKGGNTFLESLLLLIPLAATSILAKKTEKNTTIQKQQIAFDLAHSGTWEDTLGLYSIISSIEAFQDKNKYNTEEVKATIQSITDEKIKPLDFFKSANVQDRIAQEWISGFRLAFTYADYLLDIYKKTNNLNLSIVQTYLYILSQGADSSIIRSVGQKQASQISEHAQNIINKYPKLSGDQWEILLSFDTELKKQGALFVPRTSQALTTAAIFLALDSNLTF